MGTKCKPGCTCRRHSPPPGRGKHLPAMSSNRLGSQNSDEHRLKISAALTGRSLSDEHRRKVNAINADPVLIKAKARSRKSRRKPAETHRQMHKRLVLDRGPANRYPCVDCSGRADAWSHNWSIWEDVAQEIRGKRLIFSTNPDVYVARCHKCHNKFDRNPKPW